MTAPQCSGWPSITLKHRDKDAPGAGTDAKRRVEGCPPQSPAAPGPRPAPPGLSTPDRRTQWGSAGRRACRASLLYPQALWSSSLPPKTGSRGQGLSRDAPAVAASMCLCSPSQTHPPVFLPPLLPRKDNLGSSGAAE